MPQMRPVALCVDLDAARLKAIEDLRTGGEVIFTARVFGTLVYQYEFLQTHNSNTETRETVNQADWARLRGEMGAGQTVLVEVPEPDATRFPNIAQSVTHWQEAWETWLRRERRQAVGDCRPALEALERDLRAQSSWTTQPELTAIFDATRDN
jgi:hypothetical protein